VKILRASLTALLVVVSITGLVNAEIYKWIDKNGVIHFGDAPPQNGGSTVKIESIPTHRDTTQDAAPSTSAIQKNKHGSNKTPSLPEQSSEYEESAVELYVTSWCAYCQKAREFFHARGIPFTEYDIEEDEDAARRKQEIDNRPGVPLAVINGQPILGFSPVAYEQALASHP
jgi:glutaredoxin